MFYTFKNFKISNYIQENTTLVFFLFNMYFCIIFTQLCLCFDYSFVFIYHSYLLAILLIIGLFDFSAHTRLYQLTIVNMIVGLRFLLFPYFCTVGLNRVLSVVLILIASVLIYKNKKYFSFLLFVIHLNFYIFIIRTLTLAIFEGCTLCFYTTCLVVYLLGLLSIMLWKVYFPERFQRFCRHIDSYCRSSNFWLSLLCAIFGFTLQYHYGFLVACAEVSAAFGLMDSRLYMFPMHKYTYNRCGLASDKWCRAAFATQTTLCTVYLQEPKPFNSMKQFLEYGIDTAKNTASKPSPIKDYLRTHPLNHPGLEITKTDDVTNKVTSRSYHAITHGSNVKGDRVEIPTTNPQSIMKEGFRVPDEDLPLLKECKNSNADAVKAVGLLRKTINTLDTADRAKVLDQFRVEDRALSEAAIEMFKESKNTHKLDTLNKLKNAKSN